MNGPTIFVIDDDHAVRDALKALLEALGLHADTYASAEEFLEAYDAAMEGCILLDVRMPGMNGFSLLKEFAAQGINLPVIMISGHGDDTLIDGALQMGAMDFIQKPFKEETLLEAIQRVMEAGGQNPVDKASPE